MINKIINLIHTAYKEIIEYEQYERRSTILNRRE